MTRPPFSAHREAEEFARVVDGRASAEAAERYAPLTRTVTLLREQAPPMPRPEFVTDLRAQLMAAADEALAARGKVRDPATVRTLPRRRRPMRRFERHLGAAAAAVVLVGSTAGLAAAAESSLPGDSLYPVKRGIEQVEVAMNTNQTARGEELLEQAATRLQEVQDLVGQRDEPQTDALIASTLDDFTESASQGSNLLFSSYQGNQDRHSIKTVRDFTTSHIGTLESLAKDARSAPPAVDSAFKEAGATLADIDRQALVLCDTCSTASPLALPPSLVDLSSAHSLDSLVVHPVNRTKKALTDAAKSREEAKAAEQAAKSVPTRGATKGPLSNVLGTGDGPLLSLPSPSQVLPTSGSQPVTNLVHSLTDPLSSAAPGPLGGTLQGVGGVLDGVTKPLDQTLKNLTSGLLGGQRTDSDTDSGQ